MSANEETAFNSIYELLHKEVTIYCKSDCCQITSEQDKIFRIKHDIGAMAYVNAGEDYGKQVIILEVVNQNNVLVEGENFPKVMFPKDKLKMAGV